MTRVKSFINSMGPGLLMAGAAIGVSHLVQSTRAGASFGYQLIIFIIIANLLKYPFFEFGHRYAIATGESLLSGYKKMGKGFLYAFIFLSLVTSIGTMAGVTFVTGALAFNLFGASLSVAWWSGIILFICAGILVWGQFKVLDGLMKFIMFFLFVATLAAFAAAVMNNGFALRAFDGPSALELSSLGFLIALMGWMPAPLETSVWQSLWMKAKCQHEGRRVSWKEAKFDFNFGYIMTASLAIIFLCLGAIVMYGSGNEFSSSAGGFTAQVVSLYTENLGEWARPLIAVAAFSTMFSTTITCFDAYSRSLTEAIEISFGKKLQGNRLYYLGLLWSGLGGLLVIGLFTSSLKTLVDIVTIAAFLTAPIFAIMNYKLIFSKLLPESFQPTGKMKVLCWLGMVYLIGFSLVFLIYKFQ